MNLYLQGQSGLQVRWELGMPRDQERNLFILPVLAALMCSIPYLAEESSQAQDTPTPLASL